MHVVCNKFEIID